MRTITVSDELADEIEAAQKTGMPIRITFRNSKYPWNLVDFRMGDTVISRIWGISRAASAMHRWNHKKEVVRADVLSEKFSLILEQQRAAAAKWRKENKR